MRTCVGCRARTRKIDLLRVVAVKDSVGPTTGAMLTPDRYGRLPGRGVYVHLDLRCLDLAERRRVFPRAFRLPGPLDSSVLRRWVEEQVAADRDTAVATDRDKET
jgi:hypothetical protein